MFSPPQHSISIGVNCPPKFIDTRNLWLRFPFTFNFNESAFKNQDAISRKLDAIAAIPATKLQTLQTRAALIEASTMARADEHAIWLGEWQSKFILGEKGYQSKDPRIMQLRNKAAARRDFLARPEKEITIEALLALHRQIYSGIFEAWMANKEAMASLNGGEVPFARPGEFRTENIYMAGEHGRMLLLSPHHEVVRDFAEHLVQWLNGEQAAQMNPFVKAVVGKSMFFGIHPHKDGNTTCSRILYEDLLVRGGIDLRGVVSVTGTLSHNSMQSVYGQLVADYAGHVNLDPYIEIMGQKLEESIDHALERAAKIIVPNLQPGGMPL